MHFSKFYGFDVGLGVGYKLEKLLSHKKTKGDPQIAFCFSIAIIFIFSEFKVFAEMTLNHFSLASQVLIQVRD